MNKLLELLRSPHIQIALATGASIIIMAYFSKWVLPQRIGYISLAIPPFLATLYEALLSKYKNSIFLKTWYWVVGILFATAVIIILHV